MRSLPLLIAAYGLFFIGGLAHAQTAPGARLGKQNHLAGVPIPAGRGLPLAREAKDNSKAWCKRIMLDEYNKTANPDPKVAEFIQEAIEEINGHGTPAKLKEEAGSLVDAGVNDALFLCLAAMVLSDSRPELFAKAAAAMEGSGYNKFVLYMTSVQANATLEAKKAPPAAQEAQFKTTLGLLRTALQAETFKANETDAVLFRLDSNNAKLLFARHGAEVCDILRASKQVPPWIAEYYDGKREVDEAWKERGTGFADTVRPEGWMGFAEHLAQARTHLVKSWKLNSTNPRAAGAMVKVAMGENEETDTMRTWFDRAVSAQMDYSPAYASMRWGLRPRWLGSIQELIAFGEECLRTKRYDTGVPYEYMLAIKDASGDLADNGAIFADAKINRNLLEMFNGYFSTPNSLEPKYLHALAAIVAYKGKQLDVAQRNLEQIDYDLASWSNELGRFVDIRVMVEEVRQYKPK